MQTVMTIAESLAKRSKAEPWRASLVSADGTKVITASLGKGGEASMGPRLTEALSIIEQEIRLLPLELRWDTEHNQTDEFEVTFLGDKAVYVELSIQSYKKFMPKRKFIYASINNSHEVVEYLPAGESLPAEETAAFSIMDVTETLSDMTSYFLVGEVTKVRDGDTVEMKVVSYGNKVEWADSLGYIHAGNTVAIRFRGIQTPETDNHSAEYGDEKNGEYAERFKITTEQAYRIADEGTAYTSKIANQKGYLVIDLDINQDGSIQNKYDRYVGIVYKTNTTDIDKIFAGKVKAINLNKSLLVEKSKEFPSIPLAIPSVYAPETYSRFDSGNWEEELGLKLPNYSYKAGDVLKAVQEDLRGDEEANVDIDTIDVRYPDPDELDNTVTYFSPLDDREEWDSTYDSEQDNTVRIGDVKFTIPPIAIQVNRQSNTAKVKTLRSRSSMMTKVGSSVTKITLQLYFHDVEDINGYQKQTFKDGFYYAMDGLRPLIAQFKRCPFLPIDNPYINDVLGINDVALENLTVSTVPGFPNSLSAFLTLQKFESTAYLPTETSLGTLINYPLMRWYYQDALTSPGGDEEAYKTYLSPVPTSGLKGDFVFTLADEDQLEYRQKAIQKLRTYQNNRQTPDDLMDQIKDSETAIGQLIRDGIKAQRVLDQYGRFKSGKYKEPGAGKENIHPAKPNPKKPDSEMEKFWKYIYDDQVESTYEKEKHRVENSDGVYTPLKSEFFFSETLGSDDFHWPWETNEGVDAPNGYAQISFKAGINIDSFKKYHFDNFSGNLDKNATMCLVPMNGSTQKMLQEVAQRGKNAESDVKDMIKDYNNLMAAAELTEGGLALTEWDIPDLIVTSMNAAFENQFAQNQIRDTDSPVMQFLGSQDPYLQVTAEGTEETVTAIRELMEEADRYARQYRLGITSGFLGVQNDLAALFGIVTVLPENILISTMPGFPGRFQIEMSLVAFDKTQKRKETLEGISPVGSTVAKESRTAKQDPEHRDHTVFEYKMRQLETYPDLELPTYEEIEAALPKIGAGFNHYPNPGLSRFLDPDFYVSTAWTFRQELKGIRDKDDSFQMRDMIGVEMYTSRSTKDPIDGTEEMWSLLKEVDEKSGDGVDPSPMWGLNTFSPSSSGSATDTTTDSTKVEGGGEVEDFLKDREAQTTPPTEDELKKWNVSYKNYDDWVKNPAPTSDQVYKYIYSQIDAMFSDVYYSDKKKGKDSPLWLKVCYSEGYLPLYAVNYKHITGKDPKAVSQSEKKDSFLTNVGEVFGNTRFKGELAPSDWDWVKNKIPRERLANLIKATFDYLSQWRQFTTNGKPYTKGNATSLHVGVGQINIAKYADNVEIARRFMWDWKYNMSYALTKMSKAFHDAYDSKDNDVKARPWDYMVSKYQNPDKKGLDEGFLASVYKKFETNYNDFSKRYATALSPMDTNVLNGKGELTDHQKKLLSGDRSALLKDLENCKYDKDDLKKLKDEKKYTEDMVRKEYQDYMSKFFGYTRAEDDKGTIPSNILTNRTMHSKEFENFKAFMNAKNTLQDGIEARYQSEDPKDLYRDMWIDMIEYDHRGRLLRAFPTFQLFIVDEGRWMSNYRLWDNLYGYNAIQSIDIHKSRKIAADTAVIQMTNMYSNLTNRPSDSRYGEHDYDIVDNLFWGEPSQELLEARQELITGMMLEPGARIHLRMGYGSAVQYLPVVFNGVITEMGTEEIVEIVAQGDGLELTNMISADPEDSNDRFGPGVTEPRDFLCELMTSKGNWFKDAINYVSDGKFFQDNPLGIQHFGMPDGKITPPGNISWFDENYGEAAQNIYSSNGMNTYSQWVYKDGTDIPFSWDGIVPEFQGGDEANIEIALYQKTVWDVAQTLAYCSPDYIAAVHPFEMRSTLFFGKPYWRMSYRYESQYQYDEGTNKWIRYFNSESRKPYMQFHYYDNTMDIIGNHIKASSDDIYTNVIVKYDGGQTDLIYADWDIYNAQQRTTVVEAPLMGGKWLGKLDNFWTVDAQALYYGYSTVRDYMKDMYKGELIVMGDPTVKPHDMCYINDPISQMHGNFLVKAVTHHFNFETGFVTNIQPDAFVVNDDVALMSIGNWFKSGAMSLATITAARFLAPAAIRKLVGSARAQKAISMGSKYADKYTKVAMRKIVDGLPGDDPDVKAYKDAYKVWSKAGDADRAAAATDLEKALEKIQSSDKIKQWAKGGVFSKTGGKFKANGLVSSAKAVTNLAKAGKYGKFAINSIKGVGTIAGMANPLSWVVLLGGTIVTESIAEMYRRKKARYQCVLMMPLTYQGRELTAGITGHKGMVIGDQEGKSKVDNFFSGLGWDGENDELFSGGWWKDPTEMIGDIVNFFASAEDSKDYYVSVEDLQK